MRFAFEVPIRYTVVVREVAISADGKWLAVDLLPGSDGILANFVELYSLDGTATPRTTLLTQKYLFFGWSRLAFSNRGERLLIGNQNGTFQQIDLERLNLPPLDPKIPFDGRAAIDLESAASAAKYAPAIRTVTLSGLDGVVYAPRFAPDDSRISMGVGLRMVLWDSVPRSKLSRLLFSYDRSPKRLWFSPDGRSLTFTTDDGATLGWHMPDGRREAASRAVPGESRSGDPLIGPGGVWTATINDGDVQVVNTKTGERASIEVPGSTQAVAFSPSGGRLAVSYALEEESGEDAANAIGHAAQYGVLFWDLSAGQREALSIGLESEAPLLAFSPDGERLAIGTEPRREGGVRVRGQVVVWEVDAAGWARVAREHVLYNPPL